MKQNISLSSLFVGLICMLSLLALRDQTDQVSDLYYYAYNEKIPIRQVPGELVVSFTDRVGSQGMLARIRSLSASAEVEFQSEVNAIVKVADENDKNRLISSLSSDLGVTSVRSLVETDEGIRLGITDEILVRFLDKVTVDEKQELIEKFQLIQIKADDVYSLFKVPKGSDAVGIANQLQESHKVLFSEPNFIVWPERFQQVIPADPYFNNQFYLHNLAQVFNDGHSGTADSDIDAPEAWAMSRGVNNIIIAVIDEGVTANHPDLPNARQVRLNGSNFGNGDPNNPDAQANNNHGNSCAGVAAATHNGEGISGVCPNCRIMPIRIFNANCTGVPVNSLADAITFARANGAHVISNSWGFNSDNPNLHPVIVQAISAATTQGRAGRGCVVAFAAGNNAVVNGFVHFPANVNVAGVLTVGASDRNDQKAFYSPLGNPASPNNQRIDVTAPSHRAYPNQIQGETFEVWTIDRPNNVGYNPYPADGGGCTFVHPPAVNEQLPNAGVNFLSYTGRFGGTSAACPQVAGIAALMLSVNPNLTQQQVFDLITNNANRVGGYVYTNGWSNELGFGRANACSAVLNSIASTINGNFPANSCVGTSTLFGASNANVSGATYLWQVSSGLQFVGSNVGSTVRIQVTGSGSQWVRLQVAAACGTRTLHTKTIPSVGIPTFSSPTVDGSTYYVGSCHGVCPGYHWARVTLTGASPYDDISWTLTPGGSVNWQWEPWNSQIVFEVIPYYTTFPLTFKGTATNACGSAQFTFCFISGPNCQQAFAYTISPNPASDELTIAKVNSDSRGSPDQTEIVIYNSSMEKVYEVLSGNDVIKVPVREFPIGKYYVLMGNKEGILRKQILISR